MLKQRQSTSALSSKTLSRPKFINNKTLQQSHNISTESGKQSRTLRNQSRNKSCFIPKHLVQSTESHLVCSNERGGSNERVSQKYKSTGKNYSTENFNHHHNVSHNVSRNGLIQSKMTLLPANKQMFSDTLNPVPSNNMLYSCQPYLSLQTNQPYTTKSRQQSVPIHSNTASYQLPNLITNLPKPQNNPLKQQLLQKQVSEMFLYKSKQLTKVLEEMHRFCISVKQLKWICQQVCMLVKRYNQEICILYERCLGETVNKSDIENMCNEAEQLLKRFNQLAYLGESGAHDKLFNFSLLLNNNNYTSNNSKVSNSLLLQQQSHPSQNNQNSHSPSNKHSSAQQNPHSWSKLIANLQQQQASKAFPSHQAPIIPSEQNSKNFTIRTFQITENNSPFKNKTLNELIRLSELRKTEFETENKENSQLWANNQQNMNHLNDSKEQSLNNNHNLKFTKKQPISFIHDSKSPSSQQKDPFDSIHLPHFSTKPATIQHLPIKQNQKSFNQTQKLYYQQEINLLKKQLENNDKQNNQYFRKLRQKLTDLESNNGQIERELKQMERENERLKRKMTEEKEKFDQFQREVYALVERALNELLECGKVNHDSQFTTNNLRSENRLIPGYIEQISRTKPFPKPQPYIMLGNNSFFELINCLEQVFRLQSQDLGAKRSAFQVNSQKNKKQQAQQRFLKQAQLNNQIEQLEKIKLILQKQIIKMEGTLESYNNHQAVKTNYSHPVIHKSNPNQDYELTQMMFAQAFTIEEMLQLNDSVNGNEEQCY